MTPWLHLAGNNSSMQPLNYGLWVNLHFFMMFIYKHCFLPMLLVFAMKCCTKMPCPLSHNHYDYCCLLPSPICLHHLLICTCLISSPIAYPPSSVLCWCLLCFFIFAIGYATFLCDSILACVHIFSFVSILVSFSVSFFKLACRYVFDKHTGEESKQQ